MCGVQRCGPDANLLNRAYHLWGSLSLGGFHNEKSQINLNANKVTQMLVSYAYFNFTKRRTENNGTEIVLYHIQ